MDRIIVESAKGDRKRERSPDNNRRRERRKSDFRLKVLSLPSRTSWQVSFFFKKNFF